MPTAKERAHKTESSPTSFEDVMRELQKLRANFVQLGQLADDARANISDDIKGRIRDASGSLEDILGNMRERGWDAADTLGAYGKSLASEAEDALRKRPMTALLVAAGVGFLISAAMRR